MARKISSYQKKENIKFLLYLVALTIGGILALGFTTYQLSSGISKVIPTPTTEIPTSTPILKATITPTSTPTSTPTFITKPAPITKSDNQDGWGKTVKIDDKTSASRFAPDDHMSTVSELNQAMNQYRQARGLPTLNFDSLLCNIAQTRANQLLALGKLDNHSGFLPLAQNQQSYSTLDEVLFGGVQPVAGVHIVEWGWDQSLTGHHEAISNPKWHDGCGGIAGYFAVFEFGGR